MLTCFKQALRSRRGSFRKWPPNRTASLWGRCADYILQEFQPFRLFVYADMDSKIKRCQQKEPKEETLSEKDLRQKIKDIDKQCARSRYYENYTGKPWGTN